MSLTPQTKRGARMRDEILGILKSYISCDNDHDLEKLAEYLNSWFTLKLINKLLPPKEEPNVSRN